MGRLFIEHPGGSKVYECKKCRTPFTNKENLRSTRFTGATGRAYLFDTAVNIKFSSTQERMMLTGKHTVRDVICIVCDEKVGWFYWIVNLMSTVLTLIIEVHMIWNIFFS